MLPSWPLNLPLSANVDTAKAQAWRFYGRQEAQDHAEPVMGAKPGKRQRPLRRLLAGQTSYPRPGSGEHPNRKCISGSDGSLMSVRPRDHTGLMASFCCKTYCKSSDFCG
jgi:hypothetical protein